MSGGGAGIVVVPLGEVHLDGGVAAHGVGGEDHVAVELRRDVADRAARQKATTGAVSCTVRIGTMRTRSSPAMGGS